MKIHEITVLPDTPPQLQKLQELAYNLYYSWNEEVTNLYKQMDEQLWYDCECSPIRFLSEVSSEILHSYVDNKNYIHELNKVHHNFTRYLQKKTWFEEQYKLSEKPNLAYFCCEYGLHESVPIYSGGLGVLSGDHIKSASDLGLPLVGVGLLYLSGYFRQHIDQEGAQVEQYFRKNLYNLPISPILNDDGNPLLLSLDIPEGKLYFNVWKLKVGKVDIYLLNTQVPQNSYELQLITDRLYDGSRETRILQEYLLGIGGFKLLGHLGHDIGMYHINEGHSAFLLLEYLRHLIKEKNLSFEEARHLVTESICFTTHTPVPAGNERFSIGLMEKYFRPIAKELGISWEYFLSFGRENVNDQSEEFCLTILALKLCNRNNGVSKLHGLVSRSMWQNLYPKVPVDEVPITSITNGVHGQTWTHEKLAKMLLSKTSVKNGSVLYDHEFYKHIHEISDRDLWEWKQEAKIELIEYTRKHLVEQYTRCNAGDKLIEKVRNALNPKALTIGFARRFATYKRGNLFLQDKQRLLKLLTNEKCPVQFVLAGKSHPADQGGKDIIKSIYVAARELNVEHKIVFLENYNMSVAKHLVTGVDLWLNTPIKPQEASGTSGMKASINGCPNVSIADGWWEEGYNNMVGWNISSSVQSDDMHIQNSVDADILYNLLENEIIPTYFDGTALPLHWVAMMKQSIADVGSQFNSIRMLKEYVKHYMEAVQSSENLRKDSYKQLFEFTQWKSNIFKKWSEVKILDLQGPQTPQIKRVDNVSVEAKVQIGDMDEQDISVECYYGEINGDNEIYNAKIQEMALFGKEKTQEGTTAFYKVDIAPNKGGKFGYTMRVIPKNPLISNPFVLGLISWFE